MIIPNPWWVEFDAVVHRLSTFRWIAPALLWTRVSRTWRAPLVLGSSMLVKKKKPGPQKPPLGASFRCCLLQLSTCWSCLGQAPGCSEQRWCCNQAQLSSCDVGWGWFTTWPRPCHWFLCHLSLSDCREDLSVCVCVCVRFFGVSCEHTH